MCKLSLFGAPALECNGHSQHIPRRKARALLAYLAVTRQSHSRESLVALLWSEHDHRSGHADLSRILSSLRNSLGADYFLTDRENVALNEDPDLWVDVVQFRRLLEDCRAKSPASLDEECHQKLAAAVDFHRADFLAGFTLPGCPAFDEWQLLQTEALRRDLSWALEELTQASESKRDLPQAIAYGQRWVGLDPLHEPAQRRLIALYARNGQLAEAHHQYQACVRLLDKELGVEPQRETKQLYEQVRRGRSKPRRYEPLQQGHSLPHSALPKQMEQEIRFINSFDGLRIAYATVGEGPPLVLTATFLRHLEFEWRSPIWQHWLEALASRHTLIRYDERGCGLSDWNVKDISLEAWVRDLEALVDHLGLDRFRLVALSQGGAVAIAYAVRHPEKVSHLILHGAYARGRFHRTDDPKAREEAETMLSLTKLGWGRDNPAFRHVFSMQLMPEATKEQLAWYDDLMRVSMTPDNAARAEAVMYDINVLELLPKVSVPTLVTHCRLEEGVPFSEGRILASQIPGARFLPLESKNHLLLPSEPAWEHFVEEVHRFVANDPRSSSTGLPTMLPATANIPRIGSPESISARKHIFVGRNHELARLNRYLDEMLAGNGRIVFVTGGAGRGKTSLLDEFSRRAQEAHSELIVAGGAGKAIGGSGDPYLPFREVLGMLTGDVAAERAGGQMRVEQARRVWALLPHTTQAILDHGPQLLDTFVSGRQLLARATSAAPAGVGWLVTLEDEVARRHDAPGTLEQTAIFGQFANVLHSLARKLPLLITLDDLQWMDEASMGLLFHLGRRLAGVRILIVGAYRPDELPRGRDGQPHPLVQILDEFKRTYGDVFIDLARADQTEGRAFVDALLDTEPNRLDLEFRRSLYKLTSGHPLFTVELLRELQSRGDLVQDEAGQWSIGQELDWEMFPARVEAVVARRVSRLDDVSRVILRVASVEGELFTTEVVARVSGMEDRRLLQHLSERLDEQHRLVSERGEVTAGRSYLSLYQFSHALIQQYIYRQIPPGERRRLHTQVADALAVFYEVDLDKVVVRLAHHYSTAGVRDKAVTYLDRAGDLAFQRASMLDAARHYQSALAHLPESDAAGRAKTLRKIGECLWVVGQHREAIDALEASYDLFHHAGDNQGAAAAQRLSGRVHWEMGEAENANRCYQQALDILEHEPESEELGWVLAGIANYHMHLGEYEESIGLGERALALARRLDSDALMIQCLCDLGSAVSGKGDWEGITLEQESLERALALNRPHDAGRAYIYISEALIYYGSYGRARDTLEEAVAYTERMHVPYIANAASHMLAEIDWLTGSWPDAIAQLLPVAAGDRSEGPAGLSQVYLSLALGRLFNDLGRAESARRVLADALVGEVSSLNPRVALLGELARAEAMLDHPAEAASAVVEILERTGKTRYLFPNINMALLYICRLPGAFGLLKLVPAGRSAWHQLERLDVQYRTPATAACRLEGGGWLALAEADAAQAVKSFEGAITNWQELGHPYDRARALSGLSLALARTGDKKRAKSSSKLGMDLLNTLAAQIKDPDLKTSFLDSALVREIRDSHLKQNQRRAER